MILVEKELGSRWESEDGEFYIRHGLRYVPGSSVPQRIKNLGPDIYHVYDKVGLYLGQRTNLEDCLAVIDEHLAKQ